MLMGDCNGDAVDFLLIISYYLTLAAISACTTATTSHHGTVRLTPLYTHTHPPLLPRPHIHIRLQPLLAHTTRILHSPACSLWAGAATCRRALASHYPPPRWYRRRSRQRSTAPCQSAALHATALRMTSRPSAAPSKTASYTIGVDGRLVWSRTKARSSHASRRATTERD